MANGTSLSKSRRGYNYQAEEGVFYLYKGTQRVKTPKGTEVWTNTESLAQLVVDALKKNPQAYTKPSSILCFQYFFCYTFADEDASLVRYIKYLKQFAKVDYLIKDHYTLFLQDDSDKETHAQTFSKILSEWLQQLDEQRLIAAWVMFTLCGSILLPYHIMNQVVEAVKAGKDFETCVLNFAQVLAAYNKKEWQIWPCDVTKVVATFTSYCLN